MRIEYVRNIKDAGIVKAVEDATMYVRTGEWVKATAAEYEKAQNGNKKLKAKCNNGKRTDC